MKGRRMWTIAAAAALGLGLFVTTASARNECVKDCKNAKKSCLSAAVAAKKSCTSDKATCKAAFREAKQACVNAFKTAKTSCKTDPANVAICSPSGAFLD